MGLFRAAWRLPALGAVTAFFYALWLVTRVSWLFSDRASVRTHFFCKRNWARAMCSIMSVRIEVLGTPPEPPFFLSSNHLSYVDIPVYFSHLDCFFLAKSEIASWPIMGLLASTTGTLFVNRTRKSDLVRVIGEVEQVLSLKRGVVFFPEGTSTQGALVERFKPSLFEVAIRTGHPVNIAAISYATPPGSPPAHLSVCWWGDMPFAPHVWKLVQLPWIRATISFGAEPVEAEDRKTLAGLAHQAVESCFIPVVEESETQPCVP